jgi:amino acid transporter
MFGKEKFTKNAIQFFEKNGIDSFYLVTLFCVIIALSYWKNYKDWKQLEFWRKGLIISSNLVAIVFSLICIMRLLGFVKF